jgi:predicted enzyme related to lactoylglutathione lyase
VAETLRRAVDGGATMPRAMYDDYGSRNATVVDPFGHRWLLHTPLAALPDTDRQGDIGYAWLTTPDPDGAAAFYAAVLGWRYSPGHAAGGRNVEGQSLPLGIGPGEPGWHLSYAVDDVAAAVVRVRAAGGTASEPEDRAYGNAADGVDDQGVAFSLHRAGAGPRSPENGARPGDLSYLTLEVVDSARFRAFYGDVLGLRFEPGRIEDGWAVPGVSPMTGISGGHERATAVPMWKVDDVPAAVERVRAAGGTATDPEEMPYGTTADCRDDQGVHFYLGDA